MKFERNHFYTHTFTDVAGKHTEFYFCTEITNVNEGTEYKPSWIANLHSISGEPFEILCDEFGNTNNIGIGRFSEISAEEFSRPLLAAVIEGKEYLSQTIREFRHSLIEKRNEQAHSNLYDFGLGCDEKED